MFSFARFSWFSQITLQRQGMSASPITSTHGVLLIALCCAPGQLHAQKMDLTESYAKGLTFDCEATVTSKGDVFFTQSEEKKTARNWLPVLSFAFRSGGCCRQVGML